MILVSLRRIASFLFFILFLFSFQGLAVNYPTGWSQVSTLYPVSINSPGYGLSLSQDNKIILTWVEGSRSRGQLYYQALGVKGDQGERKLLTQGEFFSNPQVLVDGMNRSHIVWEGRRENQELIYYMGVDSDGSQMGPQILYYSPYLLGDLNLHWDGYENLYLLFSGRDEETMNFDIFFLPFSLCGEPLHEPINLTNTREISGRISAYILGEEIHLFWMDYSSERYYLLYQVFHIQGRPLGEAMNLDRVFNLGSGDRPSLVWEDGVFHLLYNGDATASGLLPGVGGLYYLQLDRGEVKVQRRIFQGTSTIQRPFLALEGDLLGVLWQDNRRGPLQVHYLQMDKKGEPLLEEISLDISSRASHAPQMVVDKDGYSHVFWLAFDEAGRSYQLTMMNNRFPSYPSIWYRVGLDADRPLIHLSFALFLALLFSLFLTLIHPWVYLIPLFLLNYLERRGFFEDLGRRIIPFFFFLFTLLFLLQGFYTFFEEAISSLSFQLLGALLSSLVVILFIQGLIGFSLRSSINRLVFILLWLIFYHYFTYLPQVVAWL